MAEPIVDVEGLTHRYRKAERAAVDGLSFSLARGEVVGLLGPNGAGKTTTLHAVLGLLQPTAGRVRVFGVSPLTGRLAVLPRLNYASADVDLPSNLLAEEALRFYARLHSVADAARRSESLIERFELGPLRRRRVGSLSAGEHMRLKLCKALVSEPELLILDEPTRSLDPYMAQQARELLRGIQRERGVAVLYTSHNMQEVEVFCDRIVFLHQGRLLAAGTPRQVLDRFRTKSLDELFIHVSKSGELCHATE